MCYKNSYGSKKTIRIFMGIQLIFTVKELANFMGKSKIA